MKYRIVENNALTGVKTVIYRGKVGETIRKFCEDTPSKDYCEYLLQRNRDGRWRDVA